MKITVSRTKVPLRCKEKIFDEAVEEELTPLYFRMIPRIEKAIMKIWFKEG